MTRIGETDTIDLQYGRGNKPQTSRPYRTNLYQFRSPTPIISSSSLVIKERKGSIKY
jgi:hypothetical protein